METPPPPQPADTTPMLGGDDSTETLARGPQQPSLAETESDDRAPLFQSTKARTVAEILKAYTDQPYRPLRPSEFYSSGFLTENQRLPYGKVLGPATPQQIKATNSRANALPYTTIVIAAPRGATYEIGDTLLVLQLGREIDPFGNIVAPTGLAQVTEAVDDHYLASVVAMYGPIRNGQRILPVESFTPGAGTRAVPIADGIRGSLIGGLGRQELKEPQMVVFIDKGRERGCCARRPLRGTSPARAALRWHASGQRADGYAPDRSRERSHCHRYGAQRHLPGYPAGNRRDSGSETAVLRGESGTAGQQLQTECLARGWSSNRASAPRRCAPQSDKSDGYQVAFRFCPAVPLTRCPAYEAVPSTRPPSILRGVPRTRSLH